MLERKIPIPRAYSPRPLSRWERARLAWAELLAPKGYAVIHMPTLVQDLADTGAALGIPVRVRVLEDEVIETTTVPGK